MRCVKDDEFIMPLCKHSLIAEFGGNINKQRMEPIKRYLEAPSGTPRRPNPDLIAPLRLDPKLHDIYCHPITMAIETNHKDIRT